MNENIKDPTIKRRVESGINSLRKIIDLEIKEVSQFYLEGTMHLEEGDVSLRGEKLLGYFELVSFCFGLYKRYTPSDEVKNLLEQ